jgi:hypothetical protein
MKSSKRVVLSTIALLFTSGLSACSSPMKSGGLRAADYAAHEPHDKWRHPPVGWRPHTEVLVEPPASPFVIVGTVEVRTSRPVAMSDLIDELRSVARRSLHADAIMPPREKKKEDGDVSSSANPLRRYYVFDDGKAQILEAEALRFTTANP